MKGYMFPASIIISLISEVMILARFSVPASQLVYKNLYFISSLVVTTLCLPLSDETFWCLVTIDRFQCHFGSEFMLEDLK